MASKANQDTKNKQMDQKKVSGSEVERVIRHGVRAFGFVIRGQWYNAAIQLDMVKNMAVVEFLQSLPDPFLPAEGHR